MRKFIIAICMMTMSNLSFAGITESSWFEPALLCAGAGGAGYALSKNNQAVIGISLCAVGAGIGYLLNERYRNKYESKYLEEIADLKDANREFEIMQAKKASVGDDEEFSIKVRELVPGKKLDDGSVMAPTWVESLRMPGEGTRLGE